LFKTRSPRADIVRVMREPTVFHSLSYVDAPAAVRFLSAAFGFVAKGVYTDPGDASRVVHAQMDWPPGGGIMFGSARPEDPCWVDTTGHAQCYCVTETDADVDRIHDQAVAAGATSMRPPEDQPYGGRGCSLRDPEGNQWSFGSYRGE
jgi:uncharacterized glyoxalase superfamily protein PhnB